MICSGLYTALITPFDHRGQLDRKGLSFHIQRQKQGGAKGLVVLGTTGEAATLTFKEKQELLEIVQKEREHLALIVGCGANSTSQTLENLKMAADYGAECALIISPYYNRPTQEGLFRHFEALSQASTLPLLIYNNPSRTGVHIELETVIRLAVLPKICGIKECSGNLAHVADILHAVRPRFPHFSLLCGDDSLILPTMVLGGNGAISGGANLIPKELASLVQACEAGDYQKAQEINFDLIPIYKALMTESNPIPLKAALECLGLPAGSPRLPLTSLKASFLPRLKEVLHGRS